MQHMTAVKLPDVAQVAFDRAVAEMRPDARITEDKIAAFVEVMRANVLTGEIPFRRAYLRAVIDSVEVDDTEIRIHGQRTVLEHLVMGGGAAPAGGVPSFVLEWWKFGAPDKMKLGTAMSLSVLCNFSLDALADALPREGAPRLARHCCASESLTARY